jgi:O-glycosyl hydrolase
MIMNMRNKTRGSVASRLLMVGVTLAMTSIVGRAQTCTVDWNNVHQRIDGFGASSAFTGFTWTTSMANMFFSTNSGTGTSKNGTNFTFTGIGLSLLRNQVQPPANASGIAFANANEINLMQLAQARGASVWSAPWTPPNFAKNTGTANGGSYLGSGGNATNQLYARELAGYVANTENTYGVNIYGLSVQNEPDFSTTYPSCLWSASQIHDFVTNLYPAMVASNVASTLIMLPEDEHWATTYYTTTMNDPNVAPYVGVIADHNYDGPNFQTGSTTPPAALNSYGKSLWETEVSTGDSPNGSISNAVYWAQRIHLFMTVAQANGWHFWWLINLNADNEGLADNNYVPTQRMYAMGQYSRFVRPGYYRIDASNTGNALVSAYMYPNSANFVIVAVNTNASTAISQTFNLNNFPGTIGSVTPWITSATTSLSNQAPITVTGSSFTYTLPAMSVVSFVSETNLAPTAVTLLHPAVLENQPSGTRVGTLVTGDPQSGKTFTYSLVSGTGSDDNASFSINGTILQTAATFDYETKNSYTVRVRSTDQNGLFVENAFTISILNVNEAPTDIALSNASVPENQPAGTAVGTFSTTDPDAGNTFTYTLVSGTGSTDNGSFTISGNTLQTAAPFDFETKNSYSIRVRSTDQGGLFVEKVFTIAVTDVNDAPVFTPITDQTINAGQTLLVTNTATDQDQPPQTLTFNLLSGPAGGTLTQIDANDAQFSWRPLVSQAGTTNPVMVTVTDNGTPNMSATNTFNVIVNPLTLPTVSSMTVGAGQVSLTVAGTQGPDYMLLSTTNLADPNWQVVLTTNSPVTPVTLVDTNSTDPERFYLIQIGP